MSTITIEPTCPKCGAHLANWLEMFGWKHKCEIPVESNQQGEAALKGEEDG